MVRKTTEEAAANLEAMIGVIPDRYAKGVEKADWITPASSDVAEANYGKGVRDAIAKKRRQTKIKALSNDDWKGPAIAKGAAHIGDGIRLGIPKFKKNFGAVYDKVLSDLERLPERTVDFRTNIANRLVKTVESWKKHSGKL